MARMNASPKTRAAINAPRDSRRRGPLGLVLVLLVMLAGTAPAWADDCGMQDMRPCVITERRPSCDINLVESQGMCVRPACGMDSGKPCSAFERTTLDLVLKVLTPQPCDANLKLDGGVCVHPRCGTEGAAPCNVLQRIPSCDLNLAETPAGCIRPNCGRLGEAPCGIAVKRATFGPCDVNLIARNNQCVRPGVPVATAGGGAAAAQDHAAAPVAAQPRSAAPPPPPPPPPTPPRAGALPPPPLRQAPATGSATPAAANAGLEGDTDRPGTDMYGFNVAQADPAMCQASCSFNAQCAAWTYVKPGIQGPLPRCYLKSAAAAPTRNICCVSGVKGAKTSTSSLR